MKITAAQVMTRDVLTVGPDWSVEQLLEFLSDRSITGAPVVSEAHEPIGVVSLTDVARNGALVDQTSEAPEYYRRGLEHFVGHEELSTYRVEGGARGTVRDIMTPTVFQVEETTPVQEVAESMITGRIHRVFVTRKGKMVGVITSMDLLPLVRDM